MSLPTALALDPPIVDRIPSAIVCTGDWISTTTGRPGAVEVIGNVRTVRSGRRLYWVATVMTDDGPDDLVLSANVNLHRI